MKNTKKILKGKISTMVLLLILLSICVGIEKCNNEEANLKPITLIKKLVL